MHKKLLLLGSGELGKEFTIAAKRLGQTVIAVDSYAGAPSMQVADACEVIDMLDGDALDRVVATHRPDIIVPEVEAIRTERLYAYEQKGMQVAPSARAANYTMNRKAIRELAARDLGLRTAAYRYASSEAELRVAVAELGLPCVVKPLMSSSGKGQSVIRSQADIAKSWQIAATKARAAGNEVIVEAFVQFDLEITLLTVTQKNGPTLFCPPIGHVQERGDYMYSWQPAALTTTQLHDAQQMAHRVTSALTGYGIWGVEFFLAADGVVFSELSPRPHDTGMVTLAGSQNFNEFELHLRALLGLPIPEITLERAGASAVVLAPDTAEFAPVYTGLEVVAAQPRTDFRIFGKPITRPYRRMGVVVAWDKPELDARQVCDRARDLARKIEVSPTY